ncbi:hypothetical protein KJ909_01430 [Patescibacteria group bacterium]|nr:hypothetical protein [Patescibacteria group bacterium]
MSQSDPHKNSSSGLGFRLGFIFGLAAGFVLAVVVYKKNKKTFDLISQKFDQLLKDFLAPQSPSPSPPSQISGTKPSPSKPVSHSRPKTFTRSQK